MQQVKGCSTIFHFYLEHTHVHLRNSYNIITYHNAYTVLQIGLQQEVYEVYENASFVTVCIELLEGCACYRPVNARLYTEDGNATGTTVIEYLHNA